MTMSCSFPFKPDRFCDSVVHFNKEDTQYVGKNKAQMRDKGSNSKLWLENHDTSGIYKPYTIKNRLGSSVEK